MSHRDADCRIASGTNAQELADAARWVVDRAAWPDVKFRVDCGWSVRGLVVAALVWMWSGETTLLDRLDQAIQFAGLAFSRETPRSTSYQAFLKMLVRWTQPLRDGLVPALRRLMEGEFPDRFRIAGFVVLAGDGSKIALPRTASNEARFSPQKAGKSRPKAARRGQRPRSRQARQERSRHKKADSPQLALTALYHVGLRLLWDWRIGPSDSSERDHLRSMIADLPRDALITADCGFVGYDFWSLLLTSGREFVIRVGGNVRLLRKLGVVREAAGTIYLWPDKVARRRQPPLILRLVVVQGARHPWYLVTSVRDPRRLSDRQVAEIYRQRWSIELFFRDFKQTCGRGKLRSHKAEHAACELIWSLLGLWTMLLYARKQQPESDDDGIPSTSVARVLRAFGRALQRLDLRPAAGKTLKARLSAALVDRYDRRDKRSRGYPCKKYEPPAKPPQIQTATAAQRLQAQTLPVITKQKGLTA